MLSVCEYLALHSTYDAATMAARLLLFLAPDLGMAPHLQTTVFDRFRAKYPFKLTQPQFRAAVGVLAEKGMIRLDLDSQSISFTHQAVEQARTDLDSAR